MLLKIENHGVEYKIGEPQEIVVTIPTEDDVLNKTLTSGHLKIEDNAINLFLTQFDIDGLKVGKGQSFTAKIIYEEKELLVSFENILNVEEVGGKKCLI